VSFPSTSSGIEAQAGARQMSSAARRGKGVLQSRRLTGWGWGMTISPDKAR